MPDVWIVAGTRPELIKLAPVYRELQRREIDVSLIVIRQQFSIVDDFVQELLGHPANFSLTIDTACLDTILGSALAILGEIPIRSRRDVVLVQGDTASALAGALWAFNNQLLLGHVEAGLRTHNRERPFPEEVYRRLIGQLADLHFAPTQRAVTNLDEERVDGTVIYIGNTIVDQLHHTMQLATPPEIVDVVQERHPYVLVTCHRREGWNSYLPQLLRALSTTTANVVFVLHTNPEIQRSAKLALHERSNVAVVHPQGHTAFVNLLASAQGVLTDSGGVAEEATTLGVPTWILRSETERPEAVEAGAQLVGIEELSGQFLDQIASAEMPRHRSNAFGDGQAARRIVDVLEGVVQRRSNATV